MHAFLMRAAYFTKTRGWGPATYILIGILTMGEGTWVTPGRDPPHSVITHLAGHTQTRMLLTFLAAITEVLIS